MSLSKPEISDLIHEIRNSSPLQMFFFCFCPDASDTQPILLLKPCASGEPQKMFEDAVRMTSSQSPPHMGVAHLDIDGTFRFASPLFQEDDIIIFARWIQSNQKQYPDLKRLYHTQMMLVDDTNEIKNRFTCAHIWDAIELPETFPNQYFEILQDSIEKQRELYFWLTSSDGNNEPFFVICPTKKEIKKLMKENQGDDSGVYGQLRYSSKGFFVFRISKLFDNFLSTLISFVRKKRNIYPDLMLLRNARMICKKEGEIIVKERDDKLWGTISDDKEKS